MKHRIVSWIAPLLLVMTTSSVPADTSTWDVVVYGGTSAAIATAVQVKRMGKSVVIVCPDTHLGGMTSSGLGWTDSGDKDAIGGISREFYHRVWQHYQQDAAWTWQVRASFGNRNQSPPGRRGDGATMWVFEPHVAEAIFEALVAEHKIPVHRNQWLDRTPRQGVVVDHQRIQAFRTLRGDIYRGRMFVDATYEGDLMAASGVDYHVGREANETYGEQWNGIQVGVLHHRHWFLKPVDPYVRPGEPASGLLPRISAEPPGEKGDADHRLQAYCYRMCLTNVPENRIPFPKPDNYDAAQYELLLRVFDTGWREMFDKFDPLPNHKTDTNNHGAFSTDNIGMNYDYPEASYDRRAEILREHQTYQQGLMYFMANDSRVPEDVRQAMSQWGLAKDEFVDTDGWPFQIYVREARRMIGHYVMTEHDCLDTRVTPESIGMGSYTLDSHNVQRYVTPDGTVQNEGDIGVGTPRPYEIAYGSIMPRKEQCENLLVPVCISSSHIAYGSIRMEPVFMILGQSAATAACLSLDHDSAVQDLLYPVLRDRLLSDGQVLELEDPNAMMSADLPGLVLDDQQARFTGEWTLSQATRPYVDQGYRHNGNTEQGAKSVEFVTPMKPGQYEVRLAYSPNGNRATNVPVVVHAADGRHALRVNQRNQPAHNGLFVSLGVFMFAEQAQVVVETDQTDGYVIVDAVQFLEVSDRAKVPRPGL
jgi:hypothetical protein